VQASRWLAQGQNAALQGDALAKALEAQPWDPSVKSMVPFPNVLKQMNDQLEWTQALGDAMLAQQQDVLNAVQVLRARAMAAGKLDSGPQQTVTTTQNIVAAPMTGRAKVTPPSQAIAIEPTQPTQVYVPAYDPGVVYGSWPYPAYPPIYYPPPPAYGVGSALLTGMVFATGVALVGSLWGWGRPSWGRGTVDVNVSRYNNINVNRTQISANTWRHDVSHRQGVAYRNAEVNNRYRGGDPAIRGQEQSREQFRGRVGQADRNALTANRPNLGDRRPNGGDRTNLVDRRLASGSSSIPDRASGGRASTQAARPNARPAAAPQALQGIGQGDRTRAAAQRGQASRQAPVMAMGRSPAARPMVHPVSASGEYGGRAAAARAGAAGPHAGGGGRRGR
jgi:hypothetical protein